MTDNIVLVSSNQDIASRNMAQHLIETYRFKEINQRFEGSPIYKKDRIYLIKTSKELLLLDEPNFDPVAYIFLSRHTSESGIPSLTAHFPGNFSNVASFGGAPTELAYTYPSLHREYLKQLKQLKNNVFRYSIVTEPMHHGPTSFSKPVLFVEIGSTQEHWQDRTAIETVCEAVMATIESEYSADKISIGFGGTHYSEKFTNLIIESNYALGAIMPKYALPNLDKFILNQMITKSVEKVSYAILDWKGVQKKDRIISLVEESGLEIVKL
jgi:D-aminoacyl-tRNA deacylase|tara:strand:- start:3273 stop:4079 length:807 start_codon:yes stop_codon:yes gene_type:complete